jgi:hypothetical protein
MHQPKLGFVFVGAFAFLGCIEPECEDDMDCCDKPNPAYFCSSGTCMYNPYVANDYAVYNFRVQQCLNHGGGDYPADGGMCQSDLPIDPSGVWLPVPEMAQQCQSWCWAAAISMVAGYYGNYVQECELAGYKSGYGYNCCSWTACASGCNQTALPQEITTIISQLGLHGWFMQRALTQHELMTEISSGRPVYVMFQGSFSGHAAVITGYWGDGYYHLVDPWYGPQDIPYDAVLGGPNGQRWAYTIYRLSPYADGCSPGFNPDCAVCH